MATGAGAGLKVGLAAFVVFLLSQLIAPLQFVFMVLGVATYALLSGDARKRAPVAARLGLLGLVVGALGFLVLVASNALQSAAFGAGDYARWRLLLWALPVAEICIAAGFYLVAQHLAGARSLLFLRLALGVAVSVSLLAAYNAQLAAGNLVAAGGDDPLARDAFLNAVAGPDSAKALPYLLFAWGYAAILGRLRDEARPKDPWAS